MTTTNNVKSLLHFSALIFCLSFACLFYGCGPGPEESTGTVISGGWKVAITGLPTSVSAGQNSIITATVTDSDGKVVIGQKVIFSFISNLSGATLAILKSGITDGSGQAVAVYTAGANTPTASVQDTLQASVTGATGAVIITRTAGGSGATGADSISSFSALPSTVSGGQMSVITARINCGAAVGDVSNQTITFNIPVNNSGATFINSSGASVSTITISMQLAGSSSTDISLTYKAGTNVSSLQVEDIVQAVLGNGATSSTIMTRTATGGGGSTGFRMTVTATPTSLIAGAMSTIVAQVNKADGTAATGMTVNFQFVTNNSGAPDLTVVNATTDASGTAIALYTAGGNTPGVSIQDVVSASVTGSVGAAIITRLPGSSAGFRVTVTATPTSLIAGAMSAIVAQVNNSSGAVAPGQTVTFQFITNNSGAPDLTVVNATTDASGTAIALYTAGGNTPGVSIQDVVSASVPGSVGAAIITRLPASGTGNRISLSLNPAGTLSTTSSNCILTATVVRDDNVTPVANEMVTFSIMTGGGTIDPLTVTTNNSGIAHAIFTAPGGDPGYEAVVRAQILDTTNGGDAVGIIRW